MRPNKHRNTLISQLETIRTIQKESSPSKICYAKVLLKPSALAKSHRPTRSLFNDHASKIVGGGELGEIFVEFGRNSIESVVDKLSKVESETRWISRNDKKFANPSRLRSEVGGILEIQPYSSSDKRNFSIDEGILWLSDLRTGGAYIVELFEEIPPRQTWDNLDQDKRHLFETFYNGIGLLGNSVSLSQLSESKSKANVISIKLVQESSYATDEPRPSIAKFKGGVLDQTINLDKEIHSKLIKFLESHPLVRKISLPSIVNTGGANKNSSYHKQINLLVSNKEKSYPKIEFVYGGVSLAISEKKYIKL